LAKLTVIKGGGKGPPDYREVLARQHLRKLAIEILRGIVRGDDYNLGVQGEVSEFLNHAGAASAPLSTIIGDVLSELHDDLATKVSPTEQQIAIQHIVLASLALAADACSKDGFAKGRRSQSRARLQQAIDEYVLGYERRTRENGWSYLSQLVGARFPTTSKVRPKPGGRSRKILL
jgi:hypothetical protein